MSTTSSRPPLAAALPRILSGESRSPLAWAWRNMLSWPGCLLYRAALFVRDSLYALRLKRTHRLPVPVVSLGNLSAGGTGKTPAVLLLARALEESVLAPRGATLALLSRGYRPLPDKTEDSASNDEARLLAELAPQLRHVGNKNRVAAARALLAEEPSLGCFLLDDGFSHRRLARNVEIVLIDATRPFGFWELLPRGLLREPPSALKRADAVLLTRSDLVAPERLAALRTRVRRCARDEAPVAHAVHAPVSLEAVWPHAASYTSAAAREPYEVRDKRVFMLAGIGNPEAFRATLANLGAHLVGEAIWPDHHPFRAGDVQAIHAKAAAAGATYVVTTHKDAVRLAAHAPPANDPMWRYLKVEFQLTEGAELFWERVLARLASATESR